MHTHMQTHTYSCIYIVCCLFVCSYLRSAAFVALLFFLLLLSAGSALKPSSSTCCTHTHCLRFAVRRRSVAVNAGVRVAAFSFVEGNWSATQDVHSIPHTYTQTLCAALCMWVESGRREHCRAAAKAALSDMATVLLLLFSIFFLLLLLLLLVK